jgi:hypothetical protein
MHSTAEPGRDAFHRVPGRGRDQGRGGTRPYLLEGYPHRRVIVRGRGRPRSGQSKTSCKKGRSPLNYAENV